MDYFLAENEIIQENYRGIHRFLVNPVSVVRLYHEHARKDNGRPGNWLISFMVSAIIFILLNVYIIAFQ